MQPLRLQKAVSAHASTKIRLSILATALVDALGGPAEFHNRYSFAKVESMIPNDNFALPPGVWTDDTSMTLCLARSLATYASSTGSDTGSQRGGFDEDDQMKAYIDWWQRGILSATGKCFDIGNTIARALTMYAQDPKKGFQQIEKDLNKDVFGGNGSLMRVLPVGLAYWRNEAEAREYARRSSATTHPNGMCLEACEVWTGAIVQIIQATDCGERLTKLDIAEHFAKFPYTNAKLRDSLGFPLSTPRPPSEGEELEEFYRTHHSLISLATASRPIQEDGELDLPNEKALPSSGYVLHTLVAALYSFFSTETFEQGAIVAVNLGYDADTVGAVYAGLAGCWYAREESSGGDEFWSTKVKEWRDALVKRQVVEEVAEELVGLSAKLEKSQNP